MLRILFLLCSCFPLFLTAQLIDEAGTYGEDWGGYFFGVRGGLSLGSQDWSNIETELNPGFHIDGFLETIPSRSTFSFWGQAGYHQRGSRISRQRVFTFQGNQIRLPANSFVFNNLSVAIGGKQVVKYARLADLYYLLGLRAEYNLSTNLSEYDQLSNSQGVNYGLNFPIDSYDFINRFTYGVTVGGGASFPLSEAIGGFVEISAQPDLSFQYKQGTISNVINPGGGGNTSIGERAIRNFNIELSVGLRFLRKWYYLD
ncbi:hypothetical protein GGR28_001203 [Lewinella aquimaris]|uniref:Outer membrane protein beta-barrel domain-containing protein n=1 Tax=Neolewinella aquimaris TaxID=1835722 RepID=A0A840E0B0_9BACT|nr:hypothetical protein [Neolewinella aquimaris]MBB4078590.1 hypothetical protein [Neolewinella aquimaris]